MLAMTSVTIFKGWALEQWKWPAKFCAFSSAYCPLWHIPTS